MRRVLVLAMALFLAGCGGSTKRSPEDEEKTAKKFPVSAWEAGTLDSKNPTPALLWNGLIGIRLGRDSNGSGSTFFAIDEYETSGEEKIRALPNPLPLSLAINGSDLTPAAGHDYVQSIDFRTGVLFTKWKQKLSEGEVSVESRTVMHPDQRQIAQEWRLLVPPGASAQMTMAGFSASSFRTTTQGSDSSLVEFEFGPSQTPAALGLRFFGGWEGNWSYSGRTLTWAGRMLGSKELRFERTFSLAASPNQIAMRSARGIARHAPLAALAPTPLTYEKIGKASTSALADQWKTDIEIEGPVEDQQAIRSFLYYLRSAIHPEGGMSIAPMGLSSETYFGHVFWDADIWVFPALMFLDPKRAGAITRYRLELLEAARRNSWDWLNSGRPHGKGKVTGAALVASADGAKFPWESSVTGKETVPGPSRFQDHISGSVAYAAHWSSALGLVDEGEVYRLQSFVRTFYFNRMEAESGKGLVLKGTMSPDENHTGDNDLYTNVLVTWLRSLNRGALPDVYLPRDETSLLTYENDALRSYKQAAAVLAIYPLQFKEAEVQAKVMMDRFADKVTPNGPAMSDSVHALIWARIGERDKGYNTWRKSWQDFTQHPLMLFSEKRRKEVTYFTTGAAGCLQTVLYGFLGLRIDDKVQEGAVWSIPLQDGKFLSAKPNLPKEWKKVTFRNFRVLGKSYTLTVDGFTVIVKEG
ncbi:MAG TPA: hypothetical protein PLX06_05285 [Fimbriimonadaceae bacterium]|nr:hypothetical protein [Fimbriimonadaceae bacterium]